MRPTAPVGITSTALWLPSKRDSATSAVAEQRVEKNVARDLGHPRLPVAYDVSAPEMAVHAAHQALCSSGVAAADVTVLLHAWMHYQGHDLWSPAHYIADQIGAHNAVPVGIQQICNGGAAALELAVARLAMSEGPRYALVTTADRFTAPGFDRWRSDYGAAYGDAATAALLRQPASAGDLLLRALHTVAAPHLEAMHRGTDPFARLPRENSTVIDMRRTKRAYLRHHGSTPFKKANRDMIRCVVQGALCDAGLAADEPRIRFVLLPRLGRKTLEDAWIPTLRDLVAARPVDWGSDTGHLGTGDLPAGLHEVLRHSALGPGDIGLLLNAGAGFTWSCAVVEAPAAS
ncbi:ketoacyl-ACP synthase III family protein [Streptomyces purpurogeneiscleroticus]|uniref:ketoacyl-ACP synthase III family protein n=1 Tax=Streptomyces purpurogeneiscleroticus TaxID=68259 RepID=UPI001CBD6A98|nr:ketoacyl-ACP synthase III family protein [Streptomyces purpurogeneiscleroticus]MBZ4019417.1 3-oxoacyl-ACP synthase [Streptomyces purpurogeneiscleroticus]